MNNILKINYFKNIVIRYKVLLTNFILKLNSLFYRLENNHKFHNDT